MREHALRVVSARGPVLEHAVTGRSRCRRCRKRIAKDALRVGIHREIIDSRFVWLHPGCMAHHDAYALSELVDRWPEPLGSAERWLEHASPPQPLPDAPALSAAVGRPEAMLHALQALWWATRDPSVGQRIAQLSALQPDDPIRSLGSARKRDLRAALDAATSSAPDARWIDLILPWFDAPPFSNAFDIWHLALRLLDRLADPRTFEALQRRSQDSPMALRTRFGSLAGPQIGRYLAERIRHGFPSVSTPQHAVPPTLDWAPIDAWLEQLAARNTMHGDLLHRAAAGDDGALAIFADTLEGTPRGEFLLLGTVRSRSPAQRERLAALRRDWRTLCGGLAPVALRDGLRFERGLVVSLAAHPPPPIALDEVLASPDWAAVRHLEIRPNAQRRSEPCLALARHARRLESVVVPDLATLAALLRHPGSNPSVKEVVVVRIGATSVRLPTLDALPGLESIRVQQHDAQRARGVQALRGQYPGVEIC